jgi:hypothetical protein
MVCCRNGAGDFRRRCPGFGESGRGRIATADKDFGEFVFRQGQIMRGVILVRLAGISPVRKAEIVVSALAAHGSEMEQGFTVITPGAVRIRRRATKPEDDTV